jgi:hypothetical protein
MALPRSEPSKTAMRSGRTGSSSSFRNDAGAAGAAYGSPGAGPCVTSSSSALSRTLRVSACCAVRPLQFSLRSGPSGVRPRVGLRPKSPQNDAGMRIEPPPSPPAAAGTMREATAAADPPLDPPVEQSRFHGL